MLEGMAAVQYLLRGSHPYHGASKILELGKNRRELEMVVTEVQIAEALCCSRQSVAKRIKKGGWKHSLYRGDKIFALSSLPKDVQAAITRPNPSTVEARAVAFRLRAIRQALTALALELSRLDAQLGECETQHHWTVW